MHVSLAWNDIDDMLGGCDCMGLHGTHCVETSSE